jgi:hypothetical protein
MINFFFEKKKKIYAKVISPTGYPTSSKIMPTHILISNFIPHRLCVSVHMRNKLKVVISHAVKETNTTPVP